MSIQSSINSMLSSASLAVGIGKGLKLQKQQLAESQAQTGEIKKQTKIQEEYYKQGGQHEADQEAMAAYEEQYGPIGVSGIEDWESRAINYTRDTRIKAKQNHRDKLTQKKEQLRKPRQLNRHGVKYQEVM